MEAMNDEIWNRLVAYIGEHSGISQHDITHVLQCERDFWEARPALVNEIVEGEDV